MLIMLICVYLIIKQNIAASQRLQTLAIRLALNHSVPQSMEQIATGSHHWLVHLDLKGAPPNYQFYSQLFPYLSRLGVTGLLVEYEDTFPYKGQLAALRANHSFTEEQVKELVLLAKQNHLILVPLIQTFGHMEFALKLREFAHLRMLQNDPCCLAPQRHGVSKLVQEMINQVLALHPSADYIHIGSDEVYALSQLLKDDGRTARNLFMKHIRSVAIHVRRIHSSVQVIMWDDMLRHIPTKELKVNKLFS